LGIGNAPIKTPDGQAELATRARQLSQRHRTLLLLVDGRRSEAQLRLLAERAGVPPSVYDELLDMGLITVPLPTLPIVLAPHPTLPPLPVDVTLPDVAPESELPAARTLQPESTLNGDIGNYEPWTMVETDYSDLGDLDAPLEQARDLLIRAVRAEAPVAGSLTLMRLRRAHTRDELDALIDEVEARLSRPHRTLATTQLLRRVRRLIDAPVDSSLSNF
jgi:hypothetical protein